MGYNGAVHDAQQNMKGKNKSGHNLQYQIVQNTLDLSHMSKNIMKEFSS